MNDLTKAATNSIAGSTPDTATFAEGTANVQVTEYAAPVAWTRATRIAFRFCFVYFSLFVLTAQMLPGMFPLPGIEIPELGSFAILQVPVVWFGAHVLHLSEPISLLPSGSGDRLFDWTLVLMMLIIATVSTSVWSLRSKTATNHAKLYKWFRFFMRWALATTMLSYGFAKVIPLQMLPHELSRLIEPYGDFSPMGVLWSFIAASPAYEIFIGMAEVFAGTLLFWPRTTLFGLIVTLMDAIGIFTLNMTYDVPVKLFSFHLILISLVLLAPNFKTLFTLLFLQRAAEPVREPPIGRTAKAQHRWVIAQVVFGGCALIIGSIGGLMSWNTYGGGAPTSPLYGIWSVKETVIDGVVQPPLLTDSKLFKHVVFQRRASASFQRMNDKFSWYATSYDTATKSIAIYVPKPPTSPSDTAKPAPNFTYERVSSDSLLLDGTLNGHKMRFTLKLRPTEKFIQHSRGFNWVQQNPINR
ncbi:MAG: hypothetical protein ABJC26_09105 [Gemmatimonadaceae bacterium]